MFVLQFETNNAAFEGEMLAAECARILRNLAQKVQAGQDSGSVVDVNGNKCGTWHLEQPED